MTRDFKRQVSRDRHHAGFRGGVRYMRHGVMKCGYGRDIHDRAAALFNHFLYNPVTTEKHTFEINIEYSVPVRLGLLGNRFYNNHAGIVDQDVDFSEVRQRRVHETTYAIRLSYVCLYAERLSIERANVSCSLRSSRMDCIRSDDPRSRLR